MTARNSILLLLITLFAGLVVFIIFSAAYTNKLQKSANDPEKEVSEVPFALKPLQTPQQAISVQAIDVHNEFTSPDRLASAQTIKCSHENCSEAEALYVNERYLAAETLLTKKISNVTAGIADFELSDWELYRSILRAEGRLVTYTAALQSIPEYLTFKQALLIEHLSYLSQNHSEAETQAFALAALSANPSNELLIETYVEVLVAQNKVQESHTLIEYLQRLNPENEFVLRFLKRIEPDQSFSK